MPARHVAFVTELWNGTAVDARPGNAVHRKMLPDNTIPNVSGNNPAATTDWHVVQCRRRAKRIVVQWQGTVVAVSGISSAAGTDDVYFTIPIRLFATASPYVEDEASTAWETSHPAVNHFTEWDLHGGRGLKWAGSPVFGASQRVDDNYLQTGSNGFSSSISPTIQPGIGWGMADATAGEVLPAAGRIATGFVTLGFAPEGSSNSDPGQNPRGVADASFVDRLWIFAKIVWPSSTVLGYSSPSMTITGKLRCIGFTD